MCAGKAKRANACRATNIILALLAFSCQRAKGLPRNLKAAKPWRWQNTSKNNLTNLTIVPVKFHKTASSTLEAALRNSYGTHVHWSMRTSVISGNPIRICTSSNIQKYDMSGFSMSTCAPAAMSRRTRLTSSLAMSFAFLTSGFVSSPYGISLVRRTGVV